MISSSLAQQRCDHCIAQLFRRLVAEIAAGREERVPAVDDRTRGELPQDDVMHTHGNVAARDHGEPLCARRRSQPHRDGFDRARRVPQDEVQMVGVQPRSEVGIAIALPLDVEDMALADARDPVRLDRRRNETAILEIERSHVTALRNDDDHVRTQKREHGLGLAA